jgi:hypothetical protein
MPDCTVAYILFVSHGRLTNIVTRNLGYSRVRTRQAGVLGALNAALLAPAVGSFNVVHSDDLAAIWVYGALGTLLVIREFLVRE